MERIRVKQGEAKTITFTVTDKETGDLLDISGATLTFKVKEKIDDTTTIISKTGGDFTHISTGKASCLISATDSAFPVGTYASDLKTYFSSTNVDISERIHFEIEKAVN